MTKTVQPPQERSSFLDFLRILATFLVIVNHTNSYVFKACDPGQTAWWLSVLWYYCSKPAVPLFVMISGACLLGKVDSGAKVARRFVRVALALLLASYAYFLADAWVYYGLWPRALQLGAFFTKLWRGEITDGFWYLYFYLGLMLTLPLWQRLAAGMEKKDYRYLLAVTFGVGAAWPLLAHYVPSLALPTYFSLPVPCAYLGLFFAGRYVSEYVKPSRKAALLSGLALLLLLGLCLGLTRLEYDRVPAGAKYWFMDDRAAPALPVILCAVATMVCAKALWAGKRRNSNGILRELGGCAFGVYLVQDLLIAETRHRLFEPLCAVMPQMAAVLIWEIAVFAAALAVAWLLRRMPWLRRIL